MNSHTFKIGTHVRSNNLRLGQLLTIQTHLYSYLMSLSKNWVKESEDIQTDM